MRRQPKQGSAIHKYIVSEIRSVNDQARTIEHVITARVVDRDGDVIEPRGVRSENFMKNPVTLFGHDSWSFPIGRCLSLDVSSDKIIAVTQFAGLDQASPEAEQAYRLNRDGFLRAWSIGFMPITWSEDKALPGQDGWWFKESELYEYSNVCIPSNPEALSRFAKAYGLPSGATEKDLAQAISTTRTPYWDIAASLIVAAPPAVKESEKKPRTRQLDATEPLTTVLAEVTGELQLIAPLVQGGTIEQLRGALGLLTEIDDEIDEAREWLLQAIDSLEPGDRSAHQVHVAHRRAAAPLIRAREHIATAVSDLSRAAVLEHRPELLDVARGIAAFAKDFMAPPVAAEPPVQEAVELAIRELAGAGR